MKNAHGDKIATTILLTLFLATLAPSLQAQDAAGPPLLLFSTSDAVDLIPASAEARARLSQIRSQRETVAVRAVSIANFASAVHAATIELELDGRTIIVDSDVQERRGQGQDIKLFWEGSSTDGDELGLLLRQGRLSGHLLTQEKVYKIQRLGEALYALIEIKQLETTLGCDTPAGGTGEAPVGWKAYAPARALESPGVSKVSSAQAETRVLTVYTDNAVDYLGSVENLTDDVAWAIWYTEQAFDETDAYTRPENVGAEWISFEEPSSWSTSNTIWNFSLLPYDDEIFELREEYEADVVMLVLKDESDPPCCYGSSRAILPTDIDDAIFYVDAPYLGSPVYYTPPHEMGHIFGAVHGDGYYIKDASNVSVEDACFDDPGVDSGLVEIG